MTTGRESMSREPVSGTLPPGWHAASDAEGDTYYYNETTGATSWDHPDTYAMSLPTYASRRAVYATSQQPSSSALYVSCRGVARLNSRRALEESVSAKEMGDWREAYDDEGDIYYYNVITSEVSWTRPSSSLVAPSLSPSKSDRDGELKVLKVLQEVVDSERFFVDTLETLYEYYIRPLLARFDMKSNSRIAITDKEVAGLIPGDMDAMLTLHRKFLILVERDITNEHALESFLNTFSDIAGKFEALYSLYCMQFKTAMSSIVDLVKRNASFRAFITKLETLTAQSMESLLIVPIQRFFKYPLFLKEIQSNMKKTNPASPLLDKCIATVTESAKHINDSIRDSENSEKFKSIVKLLQFEKGAFNIYSPNRHFVLDTVVSYVCYG
jgi:hypothetical protein